MAKVSRLPAVRTTNMASLATGCSPQPHTPTNYQHCYRCKGCQAKAHTPPPPAARANERCTPHAPRACERVPSHARLQTDEAHSEAARLSQVASTPKMQSSLPKHLQLDEHLLHSVRVAGLATLHGAVLVHPGLVVGNAVRRAGHTSRPERNMAALAGGGPVFCAPSKVEAHHNGGHHHADVILCATPRPRCRALHRATECGPPCCLKENGEGQLLVDGDDGLAQHTASRLPSDPGRAGRLGFRDVRTLAWMPQTAASNLQYV